MQLWTCRHGLRMHSHWAKTAKVDIYLAGCSLRSTPSIVRLQSTSRANVMVDHQLNANQTICPTVHSNLSAMVRMHPDAGSIVLGHRWRREATGSRGSDHDSSGDSAAARSVLQPSSAAGGCGAPSRRLLSCNCSWTGPPDRTPAAGDLKASLLTSMM